MPRSCSLVSPGFHCFLGLLVLRLHLLQVEIDHRGIAELRLDVVDHVDVLAVDFQRHFVRSKR